MRSAYLQGRWASQGSPPGAAGMAKSPPVTRDGWSAPPPPSDATTCRSKPMLVAPPISSQDDLPLSRSRLRIEFRDHRRSSRAGFRLVVGTTFFVGR